jgi:ATP-binding cassette subfamily C protein LapB
VSTVISEPVAEPWDVPADAAQRFDPLLECLVQITALLGRPASAPALLAGLPTERYGLTPELFVRAAANVGFSAKVVRRPLAAIPDLVLPAVLLQHGRRACVVVRRSSAGKVELMLPDSGGTREVSVDAAASAARCANGAQRHTAHSPLVLERDCAIVADL